MEQPKHDEQELFFTTLTVTGWTKVFAQPEYAELFVQSLRASIRRHGLRVHAFCLMPSQVFLLAGVGGGRALPDVLARLQQHTARRLYARIVARARASRRDWLLRLLHFHGSLPGQPFAFWEASSHLASLPSSASRRLAQEYIHQEPVRSWLVDEAAHYPFSSASPECSVPLAAHAWEAGPEDDAADLHPVPPGSKPLRERAQLPLRTPSALVLTRQSQVPEAM